MKNGKQQIFDILPTLSAEDVQEVRLRVMALAALDGVANNNDDWLLKGIVGELTDRGLGDMVPFGFKVKNRRQFYGYIPKAEKVRAAFERQLSRPTKVERLALGRLLAKLLAERVEGFREVSLNALLQHVDLAVASFDGAFPGYFQSGLVGSVLRAGVLLSKT